MGALEDAVGGHYAIQRAAPSKPKNAGQQAFEDALEAGARAERETYEYREAERKRWAEGRQ